MPTGLRDVLAGQALRVRADSVRVLVGDVGGGFGMKNVLYPEWVLVLFAARRLKRPVQWIGERNEEFLGSVHGRDSVVRARLALDADGRFLALQAHVLADMGAYVSTVQPVVPTMAMGSAMGGVYDIPNVAFVTQGVFTNTTPVDAYRGAGKPEANYLIERCIDLAAQRLGMDALKLRRKNIVRRFPHARRWGLRSSRAARETVRKQIAFYASTRSYHPVLAHHGWEDVGMELHRLSVAAQWARMPQLISDEMLEAWVLIGTYDRIAEVLRSRVRGIFPTVHINFTSEERRDTAMLREIVQRVHAI